MAKKVVPVLTFQDALGLVDGEIVCNVDPMTPDEFQDWAIVHQNFQITTQLKARVVEDGN